MADAAIGGGLANRGDLLELRDGPGELIDAVSWGDVETHGARKVGEAGVPLRFGEAEVAEARSGERPVVIGLGSATLDAVSGAGMVQLVNRCEWEEALDGWLVVNGAGEVELNGLQVPAEGEIELEIEAGDREAPVELRSPAGAVVATTSVGCVGVRWGESLRQVVQPVAVAESEAAGGIVCDDSNCGDHAAAVGGRGGMGGAAQRGRRGGRSQRMADWRRAIESRAVGRARRRCAGGVRCRRAERC